ncbi:prevent-host-death family protein [Modestobacter sp. DSM 44400]|uniref:type II toxin-antitoxin system Phd/YefM family antitoxin n=1 Tax=Modestobacter sp. DSM 44400 TaxID=1550230 RepID=UPI0008951A03|nr:type II toxin-antitoxin system prevent-host-death family antitoxin [Modestobacter sp. DSM 44400]SDY89266.1 prevent-host-death family protein [Modestobacter sp. DSM 44400]
MTKLAASVGVHEAKTQLSKLLRLVDAGQEVEILRNGEPVARLVPAGTRAVRRFGTDRGRFVVPEDFDAALPAEVLGAFTR